ncbi:hypothetical protein FOXB_04448 [Fusarium oxysporum f. sp. conglutinans Fo5176]|uniref:Xylanolytic transcriptional activator regulatory domain-containing protein n=1 Tax=Fusarium oxysporum (strain Fo5176) TaxID=660025 RepID=F9FDH0_FUSOF|nr:hypothetical protein FOXB_04448 [Fusarium oxysporum f. sp. conglutinans Fo5176]
MASTKLPRATWTRITSSKRLYRSSQAVSSVGQKVYIFGGELLPREPVDNRVDVVSLDTQEHGAQTLTAPTKALSPRVGSPSTTIGSNIFLFSGRGGLEMKPIEEKGAIWRYNTADNTWDTVEPEDPSAPFPDGRSYHCITSDGVDQLYLHSGCPEKNRLNDLWAFDLTKRAWSELPSAPGPARGGSSIAFHDGKLYRMNGFDGKTEQGGALDTYNIEAGSWSTVTYKPDGVEGPDARSVASLLSITVRGKNFLITMFGERDPSALGHAGAGKMLSDVWAFDIEESTWQSVEIGDDRPVARGWFDADVARGENGKDVIQCIKPDPEQPCEWCAHHDLECAVKRESQRKSDVSAALSSHVQSLERRVSELEAALLQMRSEIRSSAVSALTPTVNLTSPCSILGTQSDASSSCITTYSQQDSAGSGNTANATPTAIWTCLGQHWYFKGIPINSAKGYGFRLFGSQAGNHSTSTALFSFPDRHTVEEFLKLYFSSPWRYVYPVIDPVLIEERLVGVYDDSQDYSPQGKASSQACILTSMAMISRLRGAYAQALDSNIFVRASQYYLSQVISQSRWEAAATLHPHACRIVYDLKGHISHPLTQSESESAADQRRRRHLRNLFWLCYIFDKDISMRSGRPPCITRDHCDLNLPDDWARTYDGPPGTPQSGIFSQGDTICFPQDLHLSQLKERLCLFICSLENSNLSDGTILCQVRQLDVDLESWRSNIPVDYRPKLSVLPDQPLFNPQLSFLQRTRCIHLQLEYNYLTTVIHTAVRRCGAVYAVHDNLPDDLHSVYHSSSDISLEASRTTLQIFKSHTDILQENVFGYAECVSSHSPCANIYSHIAFYPPIAAMALFMNILIHPLDQRARSDLDILVGCITLFQDMAMEELTNDDMDCIHELNRLVSELVRLGSSAIWKAKREWKSTTGISS